MNEGIGTMSTKKKERRTTEYWGSNWKAHRQSNLQNVWRDHGISKKGNLWSNVLENKDL